MRFKDVIGHTEIKENLIQTINDNRISHSQLFLGPEGSGNLIMALAYAQYIACVNKDSSDSCGQCPSCIKYEKLQHPDLHFAFPVCGPKQAVSDRFLPEWREMVLENPYASLYDWTQAMGVDNKQMSIAKDEAQEINKRLSLKSFEGAYKVMLIWMPEKMNITAANKLLKIIEEPPQKTLFLLVANSSEDMIGTILSRTQTVKIPRLSDEMISSALQKKAVSPELAAQISELAEGDFNRALKLQKDAAFNAFNADRFIEWMRLCFQALKSKDLEKLVAWTDSMSRIGREAQKNFLKYASQIIRKSLLQNYGVGQLAKTSIDKGSFSMENFSPYIHADNCMEIIEELNLAYRHVERNANPKILFLDTSFKIARLLHVKLKEASL